MSTTSKSEALKWVADRMDTLAFVSGQERTWESLYKQLRHEVGAEQGVARNEKPLNLHREGKTVGSLRVEVYSGDALFALGENLMTEEAQEFARDVFGPPRENHAT